MLIPRDGNEDDPAAALNKLQSFHKKSRFSSKRTTTMIRTNLMEETSGGMILNLKGQQSSDEPPATDRETDALASIENKEERLSKLKEKFQFYQISA
mmetsp:Transcript_139886/g.198110  ORF Transcript_139886/g.198110 Transcript_139886/m.198110 type:complete len:97 (+) Transcript_139886:513-803(+)